MKTAELSELMLVRLYDLAESEGHGNFYSLDEIAAEFGVKDSAKVMAVADVLESQGFIKTAHTFGGSDGAITGTGALRVESSGTTNMRRQYRVDPTKFHAPSGLNIETGERLPKPESSEIFVVHGHDEEVKQTVARFLERLHLQPIILHEQASRGRTLIEKLEAHADVGFAVILLTPDDLGRAQGEAQESPRARQNVIFEMGFFFARLSRHRVCAIYRGVEVPSDIAGIAYLSYDHAGAWRVGLARELRAAGYDVDLNDALATI